MPEMQISPQDHEPEPEEGHDKTEPSSDSEVVPDPGGSAGVTNEDWDEGSEMPGPSTGEDGGRQPW